MTRSIAAQDAIIGGFVRDKIKSGDKTVLVDDVIDLLRSANNQDIKDDFTYQAMVAVMESKNVPTIDHEMVRIIHGAIGISTEIGEFWDQLKRHLYYGKDLSRDNLIEELGDMQWYIQLICNVLGVTLEKVQEVNKAKLMKRYPEKFTSERALNRDLDGEMEAMNQELGK